MTVAEAVDRWDDAYRARGHGRPSRGDYDMTFDQALGSGNALVGDIVHLVPDISAIKQP